MSEPDEAMVEAAALALFAIDYPNTDWHDGISADLHEDFRGYARAVLSVPVVRDALARDAQVREIAKTWTDRLNGNDPWPTTVTIEAMASIAALYPSPGDRDDSEEQR